MKSALLIALAVLLTGCASYHPPVSMPDKDIPPQKLEEARFIKAAAQDSLRVGEKVIAGAGDLCLQKGRRLPFMLFVNPDIKDNELRVALTKVAGWTAQPMFFAVDEQHQSLDGKYVVEVEDTKIRDGEAPKAYWAAFDRIKNDKPVALTFSDGSKATIEGLQGCLGIVMFEGISPMKGAANISNGIETLPASWYRTTSSPDELAFLMARSLYFTSGEGQSNLSTSLIVGSAVNGLLRGLTLGMSQFVGHAANVTMKISRESHLSDADLFGLRVMGNSGYNVDKAYDYALRMSKEADLPEEVQELRFSKERLDGMYGAKIALKSEKPTTQTTASGN